MRTLRSRRTKPSQNRCPVTVTASRAFSVASPILSAAIHCQTRRLICCCQLPSKTSNYKLYNDYLCRVAFSLTSYSRVQVTSLVTCEVGPCVNNGTCVPTDDGSGFECRCPPVPLGAAPLGPNCELRRPCDQPGVCRPDAGVCHETVINQTTVIHECLCLPGFFGTRCENDVRLTTATTVPPTPVTGWLP